MSSTNNKPKPEKISPSRRWRRVINPHNQTVKNFFRIFERILETLYMSSVQAAFLSQDRHSRLVIVRMIRMPPLYGRGGFNRVPYAGP